MGDPSGIGPEVTLKALARGGFSKRANFLVIGDASVLDSVGRKLKLDLEIPVLDLANAPAGKLSYGVSRPSYGKASIEYIDAALGILKRGMADALVTGPINKASVSSAGVRDFKGHTEYLAERTGTRYYAMMLMGANLRVTLVTRHIALKDVPRSISVASILSTIRITDAYLKRYFGIRNPKICVAGLNPHAGDEGLFGDEEKRLVTPAIKAAAAEGIGAVGPVAPDAIFYAALAGKYDAVVALYHDQGLIPFKMLYFRTGVNITLGLPFVRTSPDHGTAFDIAGKFTADPSSMIEAIGLACRLSSRTRRSGLIKCSLKAS